MRTLLSLLLAVTLALPGCATARATRAPHSRLPSSPPQHSGVDPKLMAAYVRQLPVGSHVRISRAKGDDIRGTLMKNDGDPLVVQRRARIPEAPVEVPMREVIAVELDSAGGTTARAVAIGAAAAAGATLSILLILAAVFSD